VWPDWSIGDGGAEAGITWPDFPVRVAVAGIAEPNFRAADCEAGMISFARSAEAGIARPERSNREQKEFDFIAWIGVPIK